MMPFSEKAALSNHEAISDRAVAARRKTPKPQVLCMIIGLVVTGYLLFHIPSPVIFHFKYSCLSTQSLSYKQRASDLLEKNPLIDSHVDLPILIRALYNNDIDSEKFEKQFEEGGMPGHVDLPRLDKGKYGGAFWAGYYECPADPLNFTDEVYYPSKLASFKSD